MKEESVVGLNWCSWMLEAASTRVLRGVSRRRASLVAGGSVGGMFSAERSCVNWFWASAGLLGCTPGPLDQMQARDMIESESGRRRS